MLPRVRDARVATVETTVWSFMRLLALRAVARCSCIWAILWHTLHAVYYYGVHLRKEVGLALTEGGGKKCQDCKDQEANRFDDALEILLKTNKDALVRKTSNHKPLPFDHPERAYLRKGKSCEVRRESCDLKKGAM